MDADMETTQLIVKANSQKNAVNVSRIIIAIFATCVMIATLVISSVTLDTTYDIDSKIVSERPNPATSDALPVAFGAHTAGSIRDQESRGTCWDFATMRFLEERYRT